MFLSEQGLVKLGDFSLAVQLESSSSRRPTKCGTSWYIAPEVFNGMTELKSDVWSLGISLIELGDGTNPFAGKSASKVFEQEGIEA